MGLESIIRKTLPFLVAGVMSCSEDRQLSSANLPLGIYVTPDTSKVVKEVINGQEVFYAQDKVLIEVAATDVEAIASELNGKITGYIEQLRWYELQVPDAKAALSRLQQHPLVSNTELNYASAPQSTLDIENEIVREDAWAEHKIGLAEAYNSIGSRELGRVTVAVLEPRGFDLDHPELRSRFLSGYDFAHVDADPRYENQDEHHATMVAGLIAAENNGVGINGVAHTARILPVEVGRYAFKVAAGIYYATIEGADVINMSLGFYSHFSLVTKAAVSHASGHGVTLVAAAGNDNQDSENHYPSSHPEVISVGGTDAEDNRWVGSDNTGSNYSQDDNPDALLLAAPGAAVFSTPNSQSAFRLMGGNGTSLAAPLVSGLGALLKQLKPDLSGEERKRILLDSADEITVVYPGSEQTHRWKRINVYRAISMVVDGTEVETFVPDGGTDDDGNPDLTTWGLIAYISSSKEARRMDLFVIDENGRNRFQLTNTHSVNYVSWSPDGRRLVYSADEVGYREKGDIFVINVDGSGQRQLTTHDTNDYMPNWSPDGSTILFGTVRDGNWEIYAVNIDGSNMRNLTNNPNADGAPSWSPDGQFIAFHRRNEDGTSDIYVMNRDGSNQRRVNVNIGPNFREIPFFSPSGDLIAYVAGNARSGGEGYVGGGSSGIFLTDKDGTVNRRVVWGSAVQPRWSPRGDLLAYIMDGVNLYNLGTENNEGLLQNDFSTSFWESDIADPSWSPNGDKLAVRGQESRCPQLGCGIDYNVYTIRLEDRELKQLTEYTDTHGFCTLPVWSPR